MNRHGFTMIELIVLLVVVGLVATIAVPRINRESKRMTVENALTSIRGAVTETGMRARSTGKALSLKLMPGDGPSRLCQLVYLACPCATLSSIYAIRNDMEPELAARSVLMSTLFFAASLPLILFAGMKLLG